MIKKCVKSKKNAREMSELFDIDTDKSASDENKLSNNISTNNYNDDYNEEFHGSRSFDEKCRDIQSIMEHEPNSEIKKTKDVNDMIETMSPLPAENGKLQDLVEQTIMAENLVLEKNTQQGIKDDSKEVKNNTQQEKGFSGFVGHDLKFYNEIKERYPQFNLCCSGIAFQNFYVAKLHQLKNLIGNYPVLNLCELIKEVKSINLNHSVGDTEAHPELIRQKIDDTQRCRVRIATILVDAFSQFFNWKRTLELLRGKLWKDHPVKGSEKRDGLALEHLSDMEDYVSRTEGLIESAKKIDGILIAASDSLSRQLSCLDMKEKTGFSVKLKRDNYYHHKEEKTEKTEKTDDSLDEYDELEDGTVIGPVKSQSEAQITGFGGKVDSDDLGFIGLG